MPRNKIGILAGGGMLPVLLGDACRQRQQPFHVIVFEGQGDASVFANDSHAIIRIGAAGAAVKNLKEAGCDTLVMAGAIRRPSMLELRPDWWGIKFFAASGAAVLGDDGLLTALVAALEGEGFNVIGADELLPEYLMPKGVLGNIMPGAPETADINTAIMAARDLGARDIGQAAVASNAQIIIEEDADGTDAMLRRLADRKNTGGVLAKTLKPGQERRVDLPTIGPDTIVHAHAAGLAGVVIETGNAFLLDRAGTVNKADQLGLFLIGADAEGHWQ